MNTLQERPEVRRRLTDDLTDTMVRVLYEQQEGKPDMSDATYRSVHEYENVLPTIMLHKYRSDPLFHAQVTAAVARIMFTLGKYSL